jgi:hypothetical protein
MCSTGVVYIGGPFSFVVGECTVLYDAAADTYTGYKFTCVNTEGYFDMWLDVAKAPDCAGDAPAPYHDLATAFFPNATVVCGAACTNFVRVRISTCDDAQIASDDGRVGYTELSMTTGCARNNAGYSVSFTVDANAKSCNITLAQYLSTDCNMNEVNSTVTANGHCKGGTMMEVIDGKCDAGAWRAYAQFSVLLAVALAFMMK